MTGIENVQIQRAIVHKVGNPTRGEQIKLSANSLTLNDPVIKKLLTRYFLHAFNEHEIYHFTHLSDVDMNEVFKYAKTIFNNVNELVPVSAHLAQFLYSKSTHVKVKEGELYIALLKEVPFENDFVEALGIFKSETKESFIKVFEHGENLELTAENGVNINKLDKGCLVFKVRESEGFAVCILDNTNKLQDAQYWVKDFLQVEPTANNYHYTNEYMQVMKQFARQELPEHFEVTKGQQIDLMQRSLEYFSENEQFNLQQFTDDVIKYPEMKDQFALFKDNYARSRTVNLEDEFDIDLSAVKKQSRSYKSVLKLDRNFHIYIHGRRDLIERGFDESTGKNYYKIYFEAES